MFFLSHDVSPWVEQKNVKKQPLSFKNVAEKITSLKIKANLGIWQNKPLNASKGTEYTPPSRADKLTSSLRLAYFYRLSRQHLTYRKAKADISIFRAQLLVKLGPTYQYHWALVCMFPVTDDCLWSGFCLSREQSINVVTSKWSRRRGNHVQHVQVCNITIQPLSSFFSLVFKNVFIVNLVWFVFCIRQQ